MRADPARNSRKGGYGFSKKLRRTASGQALLKLLEGGRSSRATGLQVLLGVGILALLVRVAFHPSGVHQDSLRASRSEFEGFLESAEGGRRSDGALLPGAGEVSTEFADEEDVDDEKETQCAANIYSSFMLTKEGGLDPTKSVTVKRMANVFNYNKKYQYAHMSTIEVMAGPKMGKRTLLVAAWQAAPAVYSESKEADYVHLAVEGLAEQQILYSFSSDGGYNWLSPSVAPTGVKGHNTHTPVWSPVLHFDKPSGRLWFFYAQSRHCKRHTIPPTWDPGGDIKVMTAESSTILSRIDKGGGARWSTPRTILHQTNDGVPKVIANKLLVLSNGHWVLPFWREQPSATHKGVPSECAPQAPPPAPEGDLPPPPIDYRDSASSAGVLISTDSGATWDAYGSLKDSRTTLIEGSVVETEPLHAGGPPRLVTFFRTNSGCMFQAASNDGGKHWEDATPLNFPNPNTKFHIIRLQPTKPSNLLAIAYNDHKRNQFCKACRTHLHVAVSPDEGESWRHVAMVDREEGMGMRIHYPTMVQAGSMLYVAYSRFYLDMGRCKASRTSSCIGLTSKNQGIRLARIDLKDLKKLPQLLLPPNSRRSIPNMNTLHHLADHYLSSEISKITKAAATKEQQHKALVQLRDTTWKNQCMRIASEFDIAHAGGYQFLQDSKEFRDYFKEIVARKLPSPDSVSAPASQSTQSNTTARSATSKAQQRRHLTVHRLQQR